MTETRSVWAVDPLAGVVSLARFDSTRPRPRMGRVEVAPSGGSHTPRAQWVRLKAAADEVVGKILSDAAEVQLVMLAKAAWGAYPVAAKGVPRDSTAQRRLQLQSYIEDGLHETGVPVAEFPYPAAAKWAKDTLDPGMVGSHPMNELEYWVFNSSGWDITAPTVAVKERGADAEEGKTATRRVVYRYPVLTLAAIGAQAVGIECGVPLTANRKELVRGTGNGMVQYPAAFRLAV